MPQTDAVSSFSLSPPSSNNDVEVHSNKEKNKSGEKFGDIFAHKNTAIKHADSKEQGNQQTKEQTTSSYHLDSQASSSAEPDAHHKNRAHLGASDEIVDNKMSSDVFDESTIKNSVNSSDFDFVGLTPTHTGELASELNDINGSVNLTDKAQDVSVNNNHQQPLEFNNDPLRETQLTQTLGTFIPNDVNILANNDITQGLSKANSQAGLQLAQRPFDDAAYLQARNPIAQSIETNKGLSASHITDFDHASAVSVLSQAKLTEIASATTLFHSQSNTSQQTNVNMLNPIQGTSVMSSNSFFASLQQMNVTSNNTVLGGGNAENAHVLLPQDSESMPKSTPFGSQIVAAESDISAQNRPAFPVSIRFGNPAWSGLIAERATQMALQNIQSADLKLNPDDLGPVNVKVSVTQDQASVVFNSANAQVRDALDQTLIKLRDLLEQEGLNLVQAHVGDDAPSQDQYSDAESDARENTMHEQSDEQHSETPTDIEGLAVQTYGVDSYV